MLGFVLILTAQPNYIENTRFEITAYNHFGN